jgi:hypothetical protein
MATRGFAPAPTPVAAGSPLGGFQLPSVGGPTDLSRGGLLANYNANWQASRNANQDLYNRTAAGFDQILAGQKGDLAGVSNEYRQRQKAVMAGLTGANEANERDIQLKFADLLGGSMQNLADRGLGNSTITSSVQRGFGQSMADALTRSRNDFATSIANMRSQWGMAALAQKQQAALANSGLATQQATSLLSNTNVGYPDMGAYAQMIASIPPEGRNLDSVLGGGGGGYGGGGGGLLQMDPSRPVGGPGPQSSAFYTGQMTADPYYGPLGGAGSAWGASRAELIRPGSPAYVPGGGNGLGAVAGPAAYAPAGGGGGNGLGAVAGPAAWGGFDANAVAGMPVTSQTLLQSMPALSGLATQGNFAGMLTGMANIFGG